MSDGDALMSAILAHPDEDVPRLAYADWLDEVGGTAERDRAEFIRVQVALAQVPQGVVARWPERFLDRKAREKALLTLNGMRWLEPLCARGGPLDSSAVHAQFRRGFVEVVWMPAAWFVSRAAALLARAPVRELRVTQTTLPGLGALVRDEHFARLIGLDLSDRRLGDEVVRELVRGRAAARLTTLRLNGCALTDAAAYRLSEADFDWPLRELDVRHNGITERGRAVLRDRFGPDAVITN